MNDDQQMAIAAKCAEQVYPREKVASNTFLISNAITEALVAAAAAPGKCPACRGNNGDMPCAYPDAGVAGCLRDAAPAAESGSTTEQEPVEYQCRYTEGADWSEWKKCRPDAYRAFQRIPSQGNRTYDVRKLFAMPVSVKASALIEKDKRIADLEEGKAFSEDWHARRFAALRTWALTLPKQQQTEYFNIVANGTPHH